MRQTLQDLALCRTPALGGHVTQCDHCGEVRYHYHSCGNRSCPECGGSKRAAWLAKCQADLLPVPYFHVVFTLPHELSALVLGNRELMYRLLFASAKETLLEVAADPKHLGARIGVLMVLHTWGQKLEHHPHVHCVVPGGGLAVPTPATGATATESAAQAPRWVSCRPDWFLPVLVLSPVFRGKYLAALRQTYHAGELQFAGSTAPLASPQAWRTLVRTLYQKEWVVYAKEPFGGPEQVLKYLTGYTHRVALSNRRLVKLHDDRVTFTWKDYANGCAQGNDAGRMGVRASVRAAHRAQGIGADSAFWAVGSPRPRRAAGVVPVLAGRSGGSGGGRRHRGGATAPQWAIE